MKKHWDPKQPCQLPKIAIEKKNIPINEYTLLELQGARNLEK